MKPTHIYSAHSANNMKLALFDLDETLLCGDSDNAWHDILIAHKLVDADTHHQKKRDYYQQYLEYRLDIAEYLAFSMAYLAGKTPLSLAPMHQKIIAILQPIIWQRTKPLLDAHKQAGFEVVVITTTNAFISEPIVTHLGAQLIATWPEIIAGLYTGRPLLPLVEGKSKTTVLRQWLQAHNQTIESLEQCFFYTDSYNDIGLLEAVKTPVVVNGDTRLQAHSAQHNWQCLAHAISESDFATFLQRNGLTQSV